MQCSIPSTIKFNKIAQAFRPRTIQRIKLADFISVARVRPRTSKGITAVNPRPSDSDADGASAFGPIPRRPVFPGDQHVPQTEEGSVDTLACVATAPRQGARHRISLPRSASPVPGCLAQANGLARLVPKIGDFSTQVNALH